MRHSTASPRCWPQTAASGTKFYEHYDAVLQEANTVSLADGVKALYEALKPNALPPSDSETPEVLLESSTK